MGSLPGKHFKYSSTGRLIAAVQRYDLDAAGEVALVDARTLHTVAVVPGSVVSFNPDDSYVASGLRRTSYSLGEPSVLPPGVSRLWRVSNPSLVAVAELVGEDPLFSPDGRLISTRYDDGRAAFSDGRTGVRRRVLGDLRELARDRGGYTGAAVPTPELPSAGAVSRYVEVTHPREVEPDQTFQVDVELRRAREGLPDAARPRDLLPTTDSLGQPTGAPPLVVRLRASTAFDVLGQREVELPVSAEADSDPVSFQLRARTEVGGPQEINALFFQGSDVIGQLPLIVNVARPASEGVGTATFEHVRRPWHAEHVTQPDAIVTVNRTSSNGRDLLHYSYQWVAEGWPSVDAGTVELQSSIQVWAAERYQELSRYARRPAGPAPTNEIEDLDRLGENLYREAAPPALRAFFSRFLPTADSLMIYTNDPWIPWELVKPWGDGLPVEHSDFLCAKVALARWYYSAKGQTPVPAIEARRLAAIVSPANLRAVHDEWRYLKQVPTAWPPIQLAQPLPGTRWEVLDLLRAGDANVVHFATHGVQQSDGAGVAMLAIGGEEFSVEYLVGSKIEEGLRRASPLVVMNACHSARRTPSLTRTEGWAERFLELGSGAFLGANFEVHDELACRFACELYDLLRQGQPIGRAVLAARQVIRDEAPANSTWLAYCLYAHPNAVDRAG